MKIIILAGGSGKRLWPLSSKNHPKQFLSFKGEDSFLQQTVNRFADHDVLVVTNKRYAEKTKKQLGPSHGDAILIEPDSKNTAPAICYTIKYLLDKAGGNKKDVCLVCPADHYLENTEKFISLIALAKKEALSGNIVTFGIHPTYPETGYGYIEGKKNGEIYLVNRFIEKPGIEKAKKLIKMKNCFWNAGIFVFQIDFFMQELKSFAPEFYDWLLLPYGKALKQFTNLPSISIDYALMEKTRRIKMIPYNSKWSDLGDWNRLIGSLQKDDNGNFFSGKIEDKDSKNCMVFGDNITTIGLENLVIIKNENHTIVCSKDKVDQMSNLEKVTSATC